MAGAGYKLFNTGDVLTAAQVNTYLMEQTVMVFANAAARTTALSGVVSEGMISYLKDTNAVEVYDGSNWVSSDDPNAIQNTIVDAKGDLISATAADTPARLAVGNNGETLVADSSATTGLRWQSNFAAGKNKVINGAFDIWQRGTSFTPASGSVVFGPDRFFVVRDGSGATLTMSRQSFTPGAAPVAGYESEYFFRLNQSVAGSGGTFSVMATRLEDVRTFAGQTVTLSFWAKAASGVTLTDTLIRQNFGSGGSADVNTTVTGPTLTTSWQRFTNTFTLPSISGKTVGSGSYLLVEFRLPLNTTYTIDFWGIQLEAGNVATAFQTATGTLAGELAACQRYYWLLGNGSSAQLFNGSYYSATQFDGVVQMPVTMRTAPTISATSGTDYYVVRGQGDTCNSIAAAAATTTTVLLYNSSQISGTAFQGGRMETNNAAASVALSAEL